MKNNISKIAAIAIMATPFMVSAQTGLSLDAMVKTDVVKTDTTKVETTATMTTALPVVNDGTYTKLSLTDSMVMWKASKKAGVGPHNGTVMLKDGVFTADKVRGIKSGTFNIDMSTIASLDLKDNTESKAKLEGHLKSDAFFDVEKNPTAKFRVLKTIMLNKKTGAIQVIGSLTIKGKTRPVIFKAMQKMEDGKLVITSNDFKIDRTKFGVKYGSSLMEKIADRLLEDNFTASVKLVLTK